MIINFEVPYNYGAFVKCYDGSETYRSTVEAYVLSENGLRVEVSGYDISGYGLFELKDIEPMTVLEIKALLE